MESTIELLINVFVVLHFVGLASLLGGFLVQMRALKTQTAKIIPAMVHGAWTMLITGLVLVGLHEWLGAIVEDHELNNAKVIAKTIVVTLVVVFVMQNRKKESVKSSVIGGIGALTLLNVILAVFW